MRRFLQRVARPLVLVPVVALASYFLMALLPLQIQDERKQQLPPEVLASYRRDLGLGQPLGFVRPWVKLARGERLGTAAQGVTGEELAWKLGASVRVGLLALAFALVGAGLFALARAGLSRTVLSGVPDVLFAVALGSPVFLLALLVAPSVVERGVVLPTLAAAVVMALWPAAFLGRLLTSALQTELARDYVRAARARGLSRAQVAVRHVLPNLAPPLLDALAPVATALLGGSFAAERVLGLPYFGQLYVMAVLRRQVAVVVVATTAFAALLAVVTVLVELLRLWVDPRARGGLG